ncbi:MAG: ribonuclease R, partial [Pseudomonadota bacterium]|nr:ribonuclease R [Pseudomonadota bacterium]
GKAGKREIARAFGVSGGDRIELKRVLREMADEGLIEGRKKRLHRSGDLPTVTVLVVEGMDEQGEPIGVPVDWDDAQGAPPRIVIASGPKGPRARSQAPGLGDRVLARLAPEPETGGFTAKIIKLLERPAKATLGIYREHDGIGRIVPIDRRGSELMVTPDAANGARNGELVSVEIARSGRHGLPFGRVVDRVGDVSSEKAISLIALEEHGIPHVFPRSVLDEAEAAEPADMAHREDWRALPLITIDPPDARDHDDAVFAEPDPENEGGLVVTVAIADVAYYVRPGAEMDREAQKRGNSVYFPGRVVPMLPERISNDLCSLREAEERPALAVKMRFSAEGRKTGHRFHRVMMRSAAKLSYAQAQAAIDGEPDETTGPLLEPILKPLWAAYDVLARGRDEREPLGIDLPERKVILKDDGSVDRIVVPPRLVAHRLIEEFMIQANVCAAETLEGKRSPVVYRIHDEPSWEKLEALREFLGSLDMSFPKAGNLRPSQFNRVLDRVADTPNAILVNEVVLRSQSQAEYAVENIGHFGLNLRRYAHFTSPIRRYADLLVHRALIASLGLGAGGLRPQGEPNLDRIAGEISVAERRAMAAERDTVDRLIATWLAERVGARFEGRIRGVTRSGLFVELAESGADGFVPISTIGEDFYEYQESQHRLVGRSTGETFRLGDAVDVRLVEALPYAGSLRLELLRDGSLASRPGVGKRSGRGSRAKRDEGRSAKAKTGIRRPGETRQSRRKPSK